MLQGSWDTAEFKRLHIATPGLTPSRAWLDELAANVSAVASALGCYVVDLAGKSYEAGIRGDVRGPDGSAPWVFTYSELEGRARRLEAQLNPDSCPRVPQLVCRDDSDNDDWAYESKRGDAISQISGWDLEVENQLRRDMEWVIAYSADLQDSFDWKEHVEGKPILYSPCATKREVCETTNSVLIPCGAKEFRWPVVPDGLRLALDEIAKRLKGYVPPRNRPEVRDVATEERNAWIYDQCCNGTSYKKIIARLKKKPKSWGRITTPQGIKKAATSYANRHGLPPIPKRRRGRKPAS